MSMTCPVCGAGGVAPPTCRRCKADLELAAAARESARRAAVDALLRGDFAEALRCHRSASGLRPSGK
jgi:hypothetical protein